MEIVRKVRILNLHKGPNDTVRAGFELIPEHADASGQRAIISPPLQNQAYTEDLPASDEPFVGQEYEIVLRSIV